jgi:hypothetical protein
MLASASAMLSDVICERDGEPWWAVMRAGRKRERRLLGHGELRPSPTHLVEHLLRLGEPAQPPATAPVAREAAQAERCTQSSPSK